MSDPFKKLHGILRLACKSGNGFLGERQCALDKAIEHAKKYVLDLNSIILELQVNLEGLNHTLELPREVPREKHRAAPPPPPPPLLDRYPIAGFQYYDGPKVKALMSIGDPVRLVPLTTNPYDSHAVAVYWKTFMLGYLPRGNNVAVWVALQSGTALTATVDTLRPHNSYGAIELSIRA